MVAKVMRIIEQVVDLLLFFVSMGVMAYLLLAPTFFLLNLSNWIDVLIGVVVFSINFFLAVSAVKAILRVERNTKVIGRFAIAALVAWLVTGIVFFVGIGTSPFIYHIAAYGWGWYLFVWFFYTRPSIRKLFHGNNAWIEEYFSF